MALASGGRCGSVAIGLLKISQYIFSKKTDKETKFKPQNTSKINA